MDWTSQEITGLAERALEEDIGPGDATSPATIPGAAPARARVIARAPLVCAGLPIVAQVFRLLDADVERRI
jgi:nicotinate-nucleotide pyrophosphorylase (carboxylating)